MNSTTARCFIALSLVASLSLACSQSEPQVQAQAQNVASDSRQQADKQLPIQWFDGSVSEAFAQARDTHKPVFLYWGAVWCPPCNVIKSTVFTQPTFIQQTRDFIAVYLDGDSEDAQRWGEHFSAMGYPTLIVFNAAGEELTRLSSGMDLDRYSQVLALSQQSGKAVQQLAQQALNQTVDLSADDWRLLAWYSWPADQAKVIAEKDKVDFFQQLAARCPKPELAQRFALLAALYRVQQEQPLNSGEQQSLSKLLNDLLTDEANWQLNLDELQYDGVQLLLAATGGNKSQYQRLSAHYAKAMEQTWANEQLPYKVRLNSLYGLADLGLAQEAKASEELQQILAQRVNWLRQQELSPQQRQSMMPGAADMLHRVGLSDQARQIFQQELKQSVAPYYYMSYLAGLEKDLGNNEAALKWSRQAWQLAKGPATRTQWGLAHLGRLLQLNPDAEEEVVQVLQQVFQTLAAHPGAFYQRSRVRLERALPQVQAWSNTTQRRQALKSLHPSISKACKAIDHDSARGQLCHNWLELV